MATLLAVSYYAHYLTKLTRPQPNLWTKRVSVTTADLSAIVKAQTNNFANLLQITKPNLAFANGYQLVRVISQIKVHSSIYRYLSAIVARKISILAFQLNPFNNDPLYCCYCKRNAIKNDEPKDANGLGISRIAHCLDWSVPWWF